MSKNQRTGLHGLGVLWVRTCEPCYCHVEHRIFSSRSHRALWPSTWNLAAFKLVAAPVVWPLRSRDEQRHLPSELSRTVKVLAIQLCLTLCDPMDCGLPVSSVLGTLQARIPEWVALLFSWGSSQLRDRIWVSHIAGLLFAIWATMSLSWN